MNVEPNPTFPEPGRIPATTPLILLTLEGLSASSLGCYGSSWSVTPTIDALAGRGCVWDRFVATDDDPLAVFRQWCGGDGQSKAPWAEHSGSFGSIELFTDDARLVTDDLEEVFDNISLVDPESFPNSDDAATSIEQTQFAQLILMAIERCQDDEPLEVLWVHSRFLTSRWDAPRDLIPIEETEESLEPSDEVELIAEEGDQPNRSAPQVPFMYDGMEPPRVTIDEQTHPDVVTAWMRTYACQVRLLDDLLDVWIQAVEDHHPNFILAGTSGFGFGQNGWIGHRVGPLRSVDIRLPLVATESALLSHSTSLRVPQVIPSNIMSSLLGSLRESGSLLLNPEDWCETNSEFEPLIETRSSRSRIAVTTPKWFCVESDQKEFANEDTTPEKPAPIDGSTTDMSLFLKPDDIDDANDVGRLRIDVVDRLLELIGRS